MQAIASLAGVTSGVLPSTLAAGPSSSFGAASGAAGPAPFSDLLTDAVGQVNELEEQARATVSGLMAGTGVDVHQAMIATDKASMAFELSLAVRNKAVQAYQQVMSMQF
jgi:flagellar hook-basal body complex protein FliE